MSFSSPLNRQYHFVIVPTQLIFNNGNILHPQTKQDQTPRLYNYKLSVHKGIQVFSESRPPVSIQPGSKQSYVIFEANQNMHFYIPVYNPYRQLDFIVKLKSDCWKNQGEFEEIGQFSINSNAYINEFNSTGNKMIQQRVKIIKKTSQQQQFQFQVRFQFFIDHSRVDIYKYIRQKHPDLLGQRSIKEKSNSRSKRTHNYIENATNSSSKNVNYVQPRKTIQISRGYQPYTRYKSKLSQHIRPQFGKKSEIISNGYFSKDYGFKSAFQSPKGSEKSFKYTAYQKEAPVDNDSNLEFQSSKSNIISNNCQNQNSIQKGISNFKPMTPHWKSNVLESNQPRQKQQEPEIKYEININFVKQNDLSIQKKQIKLEQQNNKDHSQTQFQKDQQPSKFQQFSEVKQYPKISYQRQENPEKSQLVDNSSIKKKNSALQQTATPLEQNIQNNENIFEINISPFQAFMDKQFQISEIERILQEDNQQIVNQESKQKSVQKEMKKQKIQQETKYGCASFLIILLIGIMTYLYLFADPQLFQKKNHYYFKPKVAKRKVY